MILTVPFRSQSETLTNLKGALTDGQLLVDATVPLGGGGQRQGNPDARSLAGLGRPAGAGDGAGGVRVVSAFHSVSAALLAELDHGLDEDVLICGDSREDKARLAELVELIPGLRPVDCGPLELARILEQLTPLIISINVRHKITRGDQDHWPRQLTGPVVVLAGGSGGAKLARGMLDVAGPDELVVIANTGDDLEIYGAYVSPDPDLVTFWLADRIDARGWGLEGDTFAVMDGPQGARHRDLVQPRRPRPGVGHRARAAAGARCAPDRGPRRDRQRAGRAGARSADVRPAGPHAACWRTAGGGRFRSS